MILIHLPCYKYKNKYINNSKQVQLLIYQIFKFLEVEVGSIF